MISLLAALILSQTATGEPCYRVPRAGHGCGMRATGRSGAGFAFFEAFPAGGAGTSGVCSTTAPTGAKGEALTFTRASTAICTKTATGGLATTGIANGDLVSLANDKARVEYDSAGTLGLLVEATRTNSALRSEELNPVGTGAGVWAACSGSTTVTDNAATAPDGAVTADRVQLAAGTFNALCQTVTTAGAGVRTWTGYVKDLASSNGVTLRMVGTGDSAGDATCEALTIASGSWTRVQCVSGTYGAGLTAISVRIFNSTVSSARNFDGYFWGSDLELGAYATSYIPTVAAAVTRAAESGAVATLSTAVGPSGCIAASVTWGSSAVGAVNIASLGIAGAGNNLTLYRNNNTSAGYQIGATVTSPAVSAIGTTTHRTVLSDNAGTRAAWWDAASVTAPAASLSGSQTAVTIGAFNGGIIPIDGIVSRFQVDPAALRCSL